MLTGIKRAPFLLAVSFRHSPTGKVPCHRALFPFCNMASPAVPDESKCQYNFLGKSGLRVSNICLGTMTFGKNNKLLPGQLDETDARKLLDRFVEWGGNFIDTADSYSRGQSESIIGSWLASKDRYRFVVASKMFNVMDETNPNAAGLSRRHITHSVEQSLKRLQTDYIDLLQTHFWDEATPLEETLMALNDLVRSGKVRYLGASNVTGWQMQKIVEVSKQMGFNSFISLQQQYSLVARESELESIKVCEMNGVGVLPWSPLKGGFLTGKVKQGQKPTEGRLGWSAEDEKYQLNLAPNFKWINTPKNWAILDAVETIAKDRGKSVAQVSLRWLLQRPVVSSVVIGATKMHQLEDNMGAANGWELTKDEMKTLDDVSQLEMTYPYGVLRKRNINRKNPWNPSAYV